ncbi:MAG: hypothetical protein QM778_07255 [Myxococcales bacterium]
MVACTPRTEPSQKEREQDRQPFARSLKELRDASSPTSSDLVGVDTAEYLVRCALPAYDAITIKDHTGGIITLHGELGLAPEWKATRCDSNCEEKVRACLMARANASGKQVQLELLDYDVQGPGRSPTVTTLPVAVALLLGRQNLRDE